MNTPLPGRRPAKRVARRPARHRKQQGVASLIIVALLFFVLSLVAAYTNRNLIFEQKTSSNQYRSTLALEAAEAGVEWALSMLNSGRIGIDDESCTIQTDPSSTETTFRERYLTISATDGIIVPTAAGGASMPTCVFDGTEWSCVCPTTGSPLPTDPATAGLHPAFRVRFLEVPVNGVVLLEVQGCTRLDATCLSYPGEAVPGEGRAKISQYVTLRSALPVPPTAALTVRGTLDAESASLGAYNPSVGGSGIAFLSGSTRLHSESMRIGGAPGAPEDDPSRQVIEDDAGLTFGALDEADRSTRMFINTLLSSPATYRDQPAMIVIDCDPACDADDIRDHAKLNPGRILWAQGSVDLDSGGDLGSAASPVMLIVDGALNVEINVYGVIYGLPDDWVVTGDGDIRGALIAGGNLSGGATLTVVRDADVLNTVRYRSGSFVRTPGLWKDY